MKTKVIGALLLLVLLFSFTGCVEIPQQQPTAFKTEQQKNEENQQALINSQPTVELTTSLERENINRRLQLVNDRDKVFYVYLMSYGKVVTFYVAKGKISSVDSFNTPSERIVRDDRCYNDVRYYGSNSDGVEGCYFEVESPDMDGTYGSNGNGVFFFTTEGAYVEWNGEYLVSDFPLKVSTPSQPVTIN